MKHTTLHSPDDMFREANALDLAGFARAAEMIRQGAEVLEHVQEEIVDLQRYLDDGWGDKPCEKTIQQVVTDELGDFRRMLPEKDDRPRVFKPGELRYCTRCGRTDALKVEVHDGCHTVCCGHCVNKHRGGYANTPERAIELWNQGCLLNPAVRRNMRKVTNAAACARCARAETCKLPCGGVKFTEVVK